MALNLDLERPLNNRRTEATPCCLDLLLSVTCQLFAGVGDKCGFSVYGGVFGVDYFDGPPRRVYQTFTGTLQNHVQIFHDEELVYEGLCSWEWTGSCDLEVDPAGDGAAHVVWSEDATGLELSTDTGEETLDNAALGGSSICGTATHLTGPVTFSTTGFSALANLFGARDVPSPGLTTFSDARWVDETLPALVPEFIPADGSHGCASGTVEHYHIAYDQSFSGTSIDGPYDESSEADGDLYFCHLITDEELMDSVEADLVIVESEDCCAERRLSADHTHYEYSEAEWTLHFTPPCTGSVRVRYNRTTTVNDEEPTTEERVIEGATNGQVITVKPPTIDLEIVTLQVVRVCLSDFTIEFS